MQDKPSGYFLPVHQSLTRPHTTGGIPGEFSVLLVCICAYAAIAGYWIPAIIGGLVVWFPLYFYSRQDPHFMAIFWRHVVHRDYRRG